MKPGSTYPTNQAIAVLVAGEPGAGKSNFIFEWPDPWVLDLEGNLKSAIERHPGKLFFYDTPDTDDSGAQIPDKAKWERVVALLDKAGKDPASKTLAIDGLGRLCDHLQAFLIQKGSDAEKALVIGGVQVMTKSLWNPFAQLLKSFVFKLRSYGKPVIVTAHLKVESNELNSQLLEQRVNLQGQLQSDFPKLFTDYYAAATATVPVDKSNQTGVRYYIRTRPTTRLVGLKTSFYTLPAEFTVQDVAFKELLAKISAPKEDLLP